MEPVIRKARLEDAPGIARVHVDSWRTTYTGLIADEFLAQLSYERREKAWMQTLSDPTLDQFQYVATDEAGQVCGFVCGGPERGNGPDHDSEVYAIYLLQSAQGQGFGRRLLQVAAGELLERGCLAMLLWVLKDNQPARRFYEAVGGEVVREKAIEIGGQNLVEVAYRWRDLHILTHKKEEHVAPIH